MRVSVIACVPCVCVCVCVSVCAHVRACVFQEEDVIFTVLQPPVHGTLDLQTDNDHVQATRFSMHDIYENRVSYHHSGSEHFTDSFTFTVSDGTNDLFSMQSDQPSEEPSTPLNTPQVRRFQLFRSS